MEQLAREEYRRKKERPEANLRSKNHPEPF
jgi:hypothetical protein